jgi:hypothetical protein
MLWRARQKALVFEGGQLTAGEAEPAAQREPHGLGPAGAIEGPGHRGPPVDDDRMTVGVVHMAPADVEALAAGALLIGIFIGLRIGIGIFIGLRIGGVVEPAEEQRRVGQVPEGFGPAVQLGLEILLRDGVAAERFE